MTARDIDPSFVLTRVRLDTETSSQQFVVRHLVVALKLQEFQASVLETCQVLDLVPSSHFDAASINTYQSFQQTLRSCERFTVFCQCMSIYIYTHCFYMDCHDYLALRLGTSSRLGWQNDAWIWQTSSIGLRLSEVFKKEELWKEYERMICRKMEDVSNAINVVNDHIRQSCKVLTRTGSLESLVVLVHSFLYPFPLGFLMLGPDRESLKLCHVHDSLHGTQGLNYFFSSFRSFKSFVCLVCLTFYM